MLTPKNNAFYMRTEMLVQVAKSYLKDRLATADEIPETMRLNDGGSESYGIPYGIEGIGFIVDAQMISDLFGAESGEAVLEDLRNCPWEEFEAFCEAVDQYISTPTAAKVTLNGNEYSLQAEKTGRAASLTGVFAFAGAEKWVFADHLLNMPMD